MTSNEIFQLAGSILLSFGSGAAIVMALSYWLGGIWASRILKQYDQRLAVESDALTRRRNIYSRLVTSMRILLKKHEQFGADQRQEFLASYDEASVWAPDEVMEAIGTLLDLLKQNSAVPGSISQKDMEAAYIRCITAMRNDSGFPKSMFNYRVVSF